MILHKFGMKRILIITLFLGYCNHLFPQDFKYLMFGRSFDYVKSYYEKESLKVQSSNETDDEFFAMFASPDTNFISIGYRFDTDSCAMVEFYFYKSLKPVLKVILDDRFYRFRSNLWHDTFVNISIRKVKKTKRIYYLEYTLRKKRKLHFKK